MGGRKKLMSKRLGHALVEQAEAVSRPWLWTSTSSKKRSCMLQFSSMFDLAINTLLQNIGSLFAIAPQAIFLDTLRASRYNMAAMGFAITALGG